MVHHITLKYLRQRYFAIILSMIPSAVKEFLDTISDEQRRTDSYALIKIMQDATGTSPAMWGNIIGFGKHHYKYETGREGDTIAVGFAPRKSAFVLYGVVYYDQNLDEVKKLGTYKLGKGCLYINKLSEVSKDVLTELTTKAFSLRNNTS